MTTPKTPDLVAVVAEIERLLDVSGNYHRRIQYTDWNTTTPEHLADCFSHALRESYAENPSARFWWVETGEEGSPLIVGYLGNGPSSELNALLLGAGPSIVEALRTAQADLAALRAERDDLAKALESSRQQIEFTSQDRRAIINSTDAEIDALRERLAVSWTEADMRALEDGLELYKLRWQKAARGVCPDCVVAQEQGRESCDHCTRTTGAPHEAK